jgi:hypothetical protein
MRRLIIALTTGLALLATATLAHPQNGASQPQPTQEELERTIADLNSSLALAQAQLSAAKATQTTGAQWLDNLGSLAKTVLALFPEGKSERRTNVLKAIRAGKPPTYYVLHSSSLDKDAVLTKNGVPITFDEIPPKELKEAFAALLTTVDDIDEARRIERVNNESEWQRHLENDRR